MRAHRPEQLHIGLCSALLCSALLCSAPIDSLASSDPARQPLECGLGVCLLC